MAIQISVATRQFKKMKNKKIIGKVKIHYCEYCLFFKGFLLQITNNALNTSKIITYSQINKKFIQKELNMVLCNKKGHSHLNMNRG